MADVLKARKSGLVASLAGNSRTARKGGPRPDTASDSDEENVVKSSSGTSDRAATATSDSKSRDDDAAAVEQSLVNPATQSQSQSQRQQNQPLATSVAPGRGKNIPSHAAARKSTTGGKTSLKALKANNKRRYTPESPEGDDTGDDDSSSPKVSSRSRSGHSSSYLWDIDVPIIKPSDVGSKLTYHNSINTQLEREGKTERVRFRRGDKVFVLPDPSWLPEVSHDVAIVDLPDDEFWVAEILDCCALDQSEHGGESLGLLRVAWFYTGDHALGLDNLHEDYKKKVRKYRFDDNERIRSDHIDFVSIECFAGFADGIETFLNLTGLEVDDRERLKPPALRQKNRRHVQMAGWKVKDALIRQQAKNTAIERRGEKRVRT